MNYFVVEINTLIGADSDCIILLDGSGYFVGSLPLSPTIRIVLVGEFLPTGACLGARLRICFYKLSLFDLARRRGRWR